VFWDTNPSASLAKSIRAPTHITLPQSIYPRGPQSDAATNAARIVSVMSRVAYRDVEAAKDHHQHKTYMSERAVGGGSYVPKSRFDCELHRYIIDTLSHCLLSLPQLIKRETFWILR